MVKPRFRGPWRLTMALPSGQLKWEPGNRDPGSQVHLQEANCNTKSAKRIKMTPYGLLDAPGTS